VQQRDRLRNAERDVEVLDRQADLLFRLDQQLSAALGCGLWLKCEQRGVDVIGGTESLRGPAQTGFAGRVARVSELAVERLEDPAIDDLAVTEAELGETRAAPAARRFTAFSAGDK